MFNIPNDKETIDAITCAQIDGRALDFLPLVIHLQQERCNAAFLLTTDSMRRAKLLGEFITEANDMLLRRLAR